jgi:hypothetical protein
MQPGPPEDPYSTLEGVAHLDGMLGDLRKCMRSLDARLEEGGPPSDLQRAALQLIPASSSIAHSIRSMIREGHLVSALILLRPLLERIATLCYLRDHPEAVVLWQQGWPHGSRPSLRERAASMTPGAPAAVAEGMVAALSQYNSLVHGDPVGAQQNLMLTRDGVVHVVERDYATPGRAAGVAVEAISAVAYLIAWTKMIFDLR